MDINLSISEAPLITQNIAVRIFKASNPSVIVSVQEFTPPHASPRNITFTGLDPVVFIVNIYETPGDPVTGTLRHSFIYDPTFQQAEVKDPENLVFAGGETFYEDATWAGFTPELIIRNSVGPLAEPDQITWRLNGSGQIIGFNLAAVGDEFSAGERVSVSFVPKIVTYTPSVESAKIITDTRVITSSGAITAADAGKMMLVQGAGSSVALTLPALGTTDTFLMYYIVSEGGSHVSVDITITGGGGNIVYFGNRSNLNLIQGERAWILYDGLQYMVVNSIEGVLRVGDIVYQYDKDSSVQGSIFADGTLLNRTQYKRLWQYVQQLDASLLVSDAVWTGSSAQHARFSTGDGATTFRIPRLYTDGFLRGVDGTARLAGAHQDDQVLDHQHIAPSVGGDAPGGGLIGYGKATAQPSAFTAQYTTAGTNFRDLVSKPTDTAGAFNGNATENLVNNAGIYLRIRY